MRCFTRAPPSQPEAVQTAYSRQSHFCASLNRFTTYLIQAPTRPNSVFFFLSVSYFSQSRNTKPRRAPKSPTLLASLTFFFPLFSCTKRKLKHCMLHTPCRSFDTNSPQKLNLWPVFYFFFSCLLSQSYIPTTHYSHLYPLTLSGAMHFFHIIHGPFLIHFSSQPLLFYSFSFSVVRQMLLRSASYATVTRFLAFSHLSLSLIVSSGARLFRRPCLRIEKFPPPLPFEKFLISAYQTPPCTDSNPIQKKDAFLFGIIVS